MEMAIDTIWVLLATFLVFLMHAGFTMVETGFTRAKNAGNIIMKNFAGYSSGVLVYTAVGFAIMFGVSSSGVFGTSGFFVNDTFDHLGLTVPTYAFLIFQTVFAATAATIVSGAMAERTKFSAYLLYTLAITAIIYPVVGHWVWGGGWLDDLGFIDFAGSTVVHSVGGWAALVGASVLGARKGKFTKDGTPNAIPGHSITLGALGVFILWFGWFGFNPGSTLSGLDLSIASIAVTTNISAAAGAVVAMMLSSWRYGKPDVGLTLNGALAGLVAITAGCADVNILGAMMIGAGSGILIIFGVEFIERVLHVDDPVGAIAVHGICGIYGTLMVGVFAIDGGLLYGGGIALLGVQAIGVIAVAIWTLTTTFVLFKALKATVGLRVSVKEEEDGLDLSEHGMEAYADFVQRGSEISY